MSWMNLSVNDLPLEFKTPRISEFLKLFKNNVFKDLVTLSVGIPFVSNLKNFFQV